MALSNIGGAEPSTVTFRVASVTHDRGSTTEHQEIVVLGGESSSLAIAAVLNAAPASTAWGLAVREVVAQSTTIQVSSLAGKVLVDQNSTVWPVQVSSVAGRVLVDQNSTVWPVQVSSVAGRVLVDQNSTVWPVQVSSLAGLVSNLEAAAHGANPTAVSAGATTAGLSNRHRVPWVIGGHPNVVTFEHATTSTQTDVAIVTISTGLKIVVTQGQMIADSSNTAAVSARVGFGATTTPTSTGVLLTHPGMVAGAGVSRGDGSGIIGVGGDGEDIRITNSSTPGGSLRVLLSYYTVES